MAQYLVRGMSEWINGWIRDGRLETEDALANQDLWRQLALLACKHQIDWQWVRGHAGHPFNERCDRLAKQAVDQGLESANPPEEITESAQLCPLPPAPPEPAIEPIKDYSEFGTDEEGQLRLC